MAARGPAPQRACSQGRRPAGCAGAEAVRLAGEAGARQVEGRSRRPGRAGAEAPRGRTRVCSLRCCGKGKLGDARRRRPLRRRVGAHPEKEVPLLCPPRVSLKVPVPVQRFNWLAVPGEGGPRMRPGQGGGRRPLRMRGECGAAGVTPCGSAASEGFLRTQCKTFRKPSLS